MIAAAFNDGDLEAFLDLHEEHAVSVIPPEGRHAVGRTEIGAALAPIFARRVRVAIEVASKLESDGLALTHAQVRVAEPGGESWDAVGRGTVVSRRQSDGTWLIVLDNPMSPP
ncbi:YybH family protein [Pseudonocardia adelaidensis]|uniref:YybH family protein n=1 Tax=Pseudonocardia adelaidensis TaxID=648754 RepID=UPI0031EC4141